MRKSYRGEDAAASMDACKLYRLGTVKIDSSVVMDSLAYENATPLDVGPPPLRGEVWILGRRYSLPKEKEELMRDVRSRFWFTYRKNFKAISGTHITCDQGWGCTLRCGQMVMGNTLLLKHLGRDWRWPASHREQATYMKILKMFLDRKSSEYSLHMIAHQGADFGRPIGQWFGPNNVAQALKKLSTHDSWTRLAIHVALDMVVVVEDMKALCREPHQTARDVRVELAEWDKRRSQTAPDASLGALYPHLEGPLANISEGSKNSEDLVKLQREVAREMTAHLCHTTSGVGKGAKAGRRGGEGREGGGRETERGEDGEVRCPPAAKKLANGGTGTSTRFKITKRKWRREESLIRSVDFDCIGHRDCMANSSSDSGEDDDCFSNEVGGAVGSEFRPVLLFIPLRLGQEKFNMEYKEAIKACLTLPQSVGIIGGRPRHALYFIGHHGDNLLYLDPHTTQPAVSSSNTAGMVPDQSYHCSQPDRMNISDLDPSVALAFFCRDESDIDDLCRGLKESVLSKMQYMFELTDKRPLYWGPVERNPLTSVHEPFLLVNQAPPSPKYTCEEDSDGFEVIDYA